MAEYNFCLTDKEYLEFIDYLFTKDYQLVPLAYYKEPLYLKINNRAELDKFYSTGLSNRSMFANQFFIIHKKYEDDSLFISKLDMNQGLFYTLSIVGRGGQVIEFTLSQNLKKANAIRIVPSMLGHQSCFWDNNLTISRKPSFTLLEAYKELKSFVTKKTKPIKIYKNNIRVSKELIASAKANGTLVYIYDEVLKF